MLFNSVAFAIFLPTVFVFYWFISSYNLRLQNLLLLVASYFFYSFWDFRFLFLLIFSTLLDYSTGLRIHQAKTRAAKQFWLWLSISVNLGLLGIFKYYNFFITSFAGMLSNLGVHVDVWTLNLILPVGISFYTFHGLSYVLDIYYNRINPEKKLIDYSVFVSFFPLLVAGPIERATHLLPQIVKKRHFEYSKAADGLRQILWGLFKKMVIADNCAAQANVIFANYTSSSGSTLALGAIFFAFQIYADFSGYSDIALGSARLFGIELLRNFAFPYFSRDIAEFWRRWHISLSSWFRDYLYIPLGGSKGGTWMKVRNTFIIFLVSGFWHGANWTYIVWGALNAFYFLPLLLLRKNRDNLQTVAHGRTMPTWKEWRSMIFTFGLTTIAWVFFRSETVGDAFKYLSGMVSSSILSAPDISVEGYMQICLLLVFIVIEWLGREAPYAISGLHLGWKKPARWAFYMTIIFVILGFAGKQQDFIYFQF